MIRQRTIKKPVAISGVGLQTGAKVNVTLKGSPANSGINFIRVDLPNKPLIHIQSLNFDDALGSKERRTTAAMGGVEVQTIEHLMAALLAFSVDNVVVEVDNVELPGLDGSARGWVEALKEAQPAEQDAEKKVMEIEEAAWCLDKEGLIAAFPSEDLRISCAISYPHSQIGSQFLSFALDEGAFEAQIAPARTFCLEAEALELLKRGFGKGANCENTLVFAQDGPVKNKLRFKDEPVRHKVLDLMGDLYLVGYRLKAHVVAVKTGHRLNLELVRKLKRIGNVSE